MPGVKFLSSFVDTDVTVILFTWLVLGAVCLGMFALPKTESRRRMQAAKPTPADTLRKAA